MNSLVRIPPLYQLITKAASVKIFVHPAHESGLLDRVPLNESILQAVFLPLIFVVDDFKRIYKFLHRFPRFLGVSWVREI